MRTLTDAKVRSLTPAADEKPYDVKDTQVPGLRVRVMGSGQRTFVLLGRFPGRPHPTRRALGTYGDLTLDDAREKATTWRKLIRQGIDPQFQEERERQAQLQQQHTTFGAVAEAWFLDKLPGERKGKEVERDVRSAFLPVWERRPITEISDLDVLSVINAKKKTAPSQARNLLGHAKRLFAWAIDQRVYGVTKSPCDGLKPAKIIGKKRRRNRTLSDEELFALWRAAKRMPYPVGPVYQLLMLSALRLNEVADASRQELDRAVGRALSQRRDDDPIDWTKLRTDQLVWTIPAERMKGRSEDARAHMVPLTTNMLRVLEALPQFKKGDSLFSTNFGASPVWIGDKVKQCIDARMLRTLRALALIRGDDPAKVELAHWVNHDIRRTVRSNLSRLKVTEEAREAVMAHARPGIKGTYDLYDYLDEKREALTLWAARLHSVVEPAPSNVVNLSAVRA